MKSTMHTTVTVDLHLSCDEAKRLNEVSQLIWNLLKGADTRSISHLGTLPLTDRDAVLFESLYQHTLASSSL